MKQVVTILTLLSLLGPVCFGQSIQPTHRNLCYSNEFDPSVLDLWTVKGKKPAPLVVYFHEGGFKTGDKAFFPRSSMLRKYHSQGVAFASVNYPFLVHVEKDYLKIMNHCAEAIRSLFPIQQPMGTPLLTIAYLRKGGPPIFVYNRSDRNDRVHHPDNALFVKKM